MNYLVAGLKRIWSGIYNFAPWKAFFLATLIEYLLLTGINLTLILCGSNPLNLRGLWGFLFHFCLFLSIYYTVYRRVYPRRVS